MHLFRCVLEQVTQTDPEVTLNLTQTEPELATNRHQTDPEAAPMVSDGATEDEGVAAGG